MVITGLFSITSSMDQQLQKGRVQFPISNFANLTVFFDKNEGYLSSPWRIITGETPNGAPIQEPLSMALLFIHVYFFFQGNGRLRSLVNKLSKNRHIVL